MVLGVTLPACSAVPFIAVPVLLPVLTVVGSFVALPLPFCSSVAFIAVPASEVVGVVFPVGAFSSCFPAAPIAFLSVAFDADTGVADTGGTGGVVGNLQTEHVTLHLFRTGEWEQKWESSLQSANAPSSFKSGKSAESPSVQLSMFTCST
jgi:hypothetical protein